MCACRKWAVPRERLAFTLVELLVVVSIVVILIAIIAVPLAASKADAKKSTCAFNLRQMGIGVNTYVIDFDGAYPQTKGHTTAQPQVDDASGAIEMPDRGSPLTHLGSYGTGVAECPSDPDPDGMNCMSVPNANFDTQSYLVNGYFVWGINEVAVRAPAETVYVAERRSAAVNNVGPNCDVIFRPWYNPTNLSAPQNDMDPTTGAIDTGRHLKGANYLFGDDHCKWFEFGQIWGPNIDHLTP